MNIKSHLILILFINKATALHLLQGSLATDGVTSLNNKANLIDLSLFLPQQNPSMINRERSKKLTACSENNMDIANAHKSKTKVAITRIGTMVDMTDFPSLCIICDTIISAIVNSLGPQPLYQQILLKFVNLMNNPDFNTWYAANKTSMPSLHWHIYSFLELIFNHLAKFATDFDNVNVMSGSHLLTELNTNPLTKVLTVLKAFKDQLTLAQSTISPITILAATASKFSTRTPGTNLILVIPASVPISASALPENNQNQCCDVKRNPSTPDKGAKAAAIQRQKNPTASVPPTLQSNTQSLIWTCSSSPETTPRPSTSSPRTCPPRFVPNLPVRVVNAPESPAHIASPGMLTNYLQKLLLQLLNKRHFMKLAHLLPDVKALVGGKNGPTSNKRA
jgi:hypothetical protein